MFGYDGWTTPPSTQSYLTLSALKGYELLSQKYEDSLHMLIESYRIFAADRDNITYDYGANLHNFKGVDIDYIEEKYNFTTMKVLESLNFLNQRVEVQHT